MILDTYLNLAEWQLAPSYRTGAICVCMDLRTSSDCFPIQSYVLVFVTKKESVYCAVRTESLIIMQVNLSV